MARCRDEPAGGRPRSLSAAEAALAATCVRTLLVLVRMRAAAPAAPSVWQLLGWPLLTGLLHAAAAAPPTVRGRRDTTRPRLLADEPPPDAARGCGDNDDLDGRWELVLLAALGKCELTPSDGAGAGALAAAHAATTALERHAAIRGAADLRLRARALCGLVDWLARGCASSEQFRADLLANGHARSPVARLQATAAAWSRHAPLSALPALHHAAHGDSVLAAELAAALRTLAALDA